MAIRFLSSNMKFSSYLLVVIHGVFFFKYLRLKIAEHETLSNGEKFHSDLLVVLGVLL